MLSIAGRATSKLQDLLTSANGLNASLAVIAQSESVTVPPISPASVFTDNVSSDLAEKSVEPKYTAIYIYCDKMANLLTEKFRSFSGTIEMTIDVRISQDRLAGIDQASQLYAAGGDSNAQPEPRRLGPGPLLCRPVRGIVRAGKARGP
jgi:hypothetical protein